MVKTFAAAFGAVLFFIAGAHAADPAPLTDDQVKRFVASMSDVEAFANEMEASGKSDGLKLTQAPGAGAEFKPYSEAVAALKVKFPPDYARLGTIVQPHGFSAESWGLTGDRVIRAYIAEKMERDNPGAAAKAAAAAQKMAAMDPNMLAMMPPDATAKMQSSIALMKFLEATPEADREVVSPYLDDIDAMTDA